MIEDSALRPPPPRESLRERREQRRLIHGPAQRSLGDPVLFAPLDLDGSNPENEVEQTGLTNEGDREENGLNIGIILSDSDETVDLNGSLSSTGAAASPNLSNPTAQALMMANADSSLARNTLFNPERRLSGTAGRALRKIRMHPNDAAADEVDLGLVAPDEEGNTGPRHR